MQLFNKLETKGIIKRGAYSSLVSKILQAAGYNDQDVIETIRKFEKRIHDTVTNPWRAGVIESPQITQGAGGAIYDGVLLHTENCRTEAIKFLSVATGYVGDAQIKLIDELGLANLTKFKAMEEVMNRCRYVFVLMTEDFNDDAFLSFATQMCLDEFIEKNERRVVPLWTESSGLIRYPRELKLLSGLKYHLMQNKGESKQLYHNIFIHGLQMLIQSGREKILVRGET